MRKETKNNPLKTAFIYLALIVIAAITIYLLVNGLVKTKAELRDNDSSRYETHIIYKQSDGTIIETTALDVKQNNSAQTIQIYLDDAALTVPFDDFIVYRDKPSNTSKYNSEPSEITITMPNGETETITGYAYTAEKGFSNPDKYLLVSPFYVIKTANREYYTSGKNLFIQKIQ